MFRSNFNRRTISNPAIETLEERRLLSADLTGVFANSVPLTLQNGDKNHAAVRVTNVGDEKLAGPVTVDLFASPLGGSTDDQTLLTSVTRTMNLKPGRGNLVNFKFAEPQSLADGSYSLVAQISSQTLNDTGAPDDIVVAPAPITVQQPFVDLTAQTVTAPSQPIVIDDGQEREEPASVTIVNHGSASAFGTVSVNFYLSTDTTLDGQDVLAGSILNTPLTLKANAARKFSTLIGAPVNTPAGTYYLFAVVTPVSGIVQHNPADEVGLAARQVTVEVIGYLPTSTGMQDGSQAVTYDGTSYICTPGHTGTIAPCPPPVNCTPTTGPTTSSSDDDGGQPSDQDDSQPSSDDDSQQSQDGSDNSQSDPSGDQSGTTQPAPPTQPDPSTGDSGSDSSADTSGDDSSDTSSDDSGDTSSDDSGDTSSDDSGDTSSDDSGDDSGDDSSDDSGDDMSDDIARRSTGKTSHKTSTVRQGASSTPKHAVVYKTAGHLPSGGHK